jgi:molybdate transport system regulatory protein
MAITGVDENAGRASATPSGAGGAEAGEGQNVLTPAQLGLLGEAFAQWVQAARGEKTRVSRNRAKLVYLFLRYTGAKLGEILSLDDTRDFALAYRKVVLGAGGRPGKKSREVYLPAELYLEVKQVMRDPAYSPLRGHFFSMDQGYVRRVIYERAKECGLPKNLANPNTIRRSRAVELLNSGMSLILVQRILGLSTAISSSLTFAVEGGEQRIQERRLAMAPLASQQGMYNIFRGRVQSIVREDLQFRVTVAVPGGHTLVLLLADVAQPSGEIVEGGEVAVRVSSTLMTVQPGARPAAAPGQNSIPAEVFDVIQGRTTAKAILRTAEGVRLCAVMSLEQLTGLGLTRSQEAWVSFDPAAVTIV